jgi:Kef-type K+ transport system membrane component KefB
MHFWSFEGWRSADPLLGLAIVMLIGVIAADVLYRTARLPHVTGLMLVGALASPLALRYI